MESNCQRGAPSFCIAQLFNAVFSTVEVYLLKTLIRRIYILGILFILAFGVIFVANNYQSSDRIMRYEVEDNVTLRLELVMKAFSSEFGRVEQTINMVDAVLQQIQDFNEITEVLTIFLQQNPSYLSICFHTKEGEMFCAGDWQSLEDVNSQGEVWYVAAADAEGLVVINHQTALVDGGPVVTLAKPSLGSAGEVLGVVGINLLCDEIFLFLDSDKALKNPYSSFFDKDGNLVVHPATRYGYGRDFSLSEVLGVDFKNQPSGISYVTLHGVENVYKWDRIPGTDLTVGIFASVSDFFDRGALIKETVNATLLTGMVLLLLLMFFQKKNLIDPIKQFQGDVERISLADDSSYRLQVADKNLFRSLRETINMLLDKVQEQRERVSYQQEELQAAYEQVVAHEQQFQGQFTEIKQQETQIRFLADHDPLTGLSNRRKFTEDLERLITNDNTGAVLILDIDDFKNINDVQGHIYGDRVLQLVAQFLQKELDSCAKAYRFGGDEFLIIADGLDNPHELEQHILEAGKDFRKSSSIHQKSSNITVSIGIVRFPYDGETVEELLSKADIALHYAKETGKARHVFFEDTMGLSFSERVQMEKILQETIDSENFTLLYQPIVNARTGKVAYFEALIRIKGLPISPGVFISIAERSTLIFPIGRWVIKAVIAQLVEWKKFGKDMIPISINFSARQFYDEGLVNFLVEELEKNDVDSSLIEIEITETVFIDNIDKARAIMQKIRDLGIKIALDDFGTGYSSINFITSIPVDRIKLDRSMIEKLIQNMQVLEGLIFIAHGLKMDVVAEGVERIEEVHLLNQVHCDYLQGYLFSVPVPPEQAELLFERDFSKILGLDEA